MLFINLHGRGLVCCRIILGPLAFSPRLAGIQIAIPAAVFGRLALSGGIRLGDAERYVHSAAAISEQGIHLQSARGHRGDCVHVVAGRQGG
jgi:hypothetical protein